MPVTGTVPTFTTSRPTVRLALTPTFPKSSSVADAASPGVAPKNVSSLSKTARAQTRQKCSLESRILQTYAGR